MQEAVGGDQLHAAVFRPAAQQRLQDARGGTFTHGHAACDTNDIRNALTVRPEKLLQHGLTTQVRADIEVKQAREGEINFCHLFQGQIFVYPF